MFCIGAAPTRPGIRDKFSTPPKPLLTHHWTKSCQFSPAITLITTLFLFSSIISIPFKPIFKHSPSKNFVNRILLPPPRTVIFFVLFSDKIFFKSFKFLTMKKDSEAISKPKVFDFSRE